MELDWYSKLIFFFTLFSKEMTLCYLVLPAAVFGNVVTHTSIIYACINCTHVQVAEDHNYFDF